MPAPLDVPWVKIRRLYEEGARVIDLANKYGIKRETVHKRQSANKWTIPSKEVRELYRAAHLLKENLDGTQDASVNKALSSKGKGYSASGLHRIVGEDALKKIVSSPDNEVSISDIAENYKGKTAKKLFQILATTTIAPPKTWRDFELMDKIMRRTLGLDEGGSKSSTVVSLQIVNDRLRSASSGDIVEGEIIEATIIEDAPSIVDSVVESVMDASSDTDSHCES